MQNPLPPLCAYRSPRPSFEVPPYHLHLDDLPQTPNNRMFGHRHNAHYAVKPLASANFQLQQCIGIISIAKGNHQNRLCTSSSNRRKTISDRGRTPPNAGTPRMTTSFSVSAKADTDPCAGSNEMVSFSQSKPLAMLLQIFLFPCWAKQLIKFHTPPTFSCNLS